MRNPKFSFVGNLQNLGCMGPFQIIDEVYRLVRLFCAHFEKVEPKGRGMTYYKTKVEDIIINLTTDSVESILTPTLQTSLVIPLL